MKTENLHEHARRTRWPAQAGHSNTLLLLISWLWVGVPLAWGVSQTIKTSLALFK